jgi:GNAT superfamily N-acetyltransferase
VRVRIPPRVLRLDDDLRRPTAATRLRAGRHAGSGRLSGEVLIRPATAADADAIAALLVTTWRAAYRGIVPDEFLARLDPAERAARWRELIPDTTVLVAEEDGELAGVAALAIPARELDEPGIGEIAVLYVHPSHWRRGIGRALVDAAGAELRDGGCDEAVLWVFEANASGRGFYAALGFSPDGARQARGEAGPPEVRLRARLD